MQQMESQKLLEFSIMKDIIGLSDDYQTDDTLSLQ